MVQACQTCLRVLKKPSKVFHFDAIAGPNGISVKNMLLNCVPELILHEVQNGVLCRACVATLKTAFEYRQRCLEVQKRIFECLQRQPLNAIANVGPITSYMKLDTEMEGVNFNTNGEVLDDVGPQPAWNPNNGIIVHEVPTAVDELASTFTCNLCPFECETYFALKVHKKIHFSLRQLYPPSPNQICVPGNGAHGSKLEVDRIGNLQENGAEIYFPGGIVRTVCQLRSKKRKRSETPEVIKTSLVNHSRSRPRVRRRNARYKRPQMNCKIEATDVKVAPNYKFYEDFK